MNFRNSLLLAFVTFCFTLNAQQQILTPTLPVDPDTKKIQYRAVIEEKGSVEYLYNKAIEWFSYYYLNPSAIFNVQDKVNGKIEGTGRMKIYYTDEKSGVRMDGGLIVYLIKIELKENKYRYTLTDFNLKGLSRFPVERWTNKSDPSYNPQWDSYLYQIDTTMQRLVLTLTEKMKPVIPKKDEW